MPCLYLRCLWVIPVEERKKFNMNNSVKYFIYIAGSVLVFVFLIKTLYSPNLDTNKAVAFEWEKTVNVYFMDSKLPGRGA